MSDVSERVRGWIRVGVSYCVEHHGIAEEGEERCDFRGVDEHACKLRVLFYPEPTGNVCTGVTATYCPVCGQCTCNRHDDGEVEFGEGDRPCPLHDEGSPHPLDSGANQRSADV